MKSIAWTPAAFIALRLPLIIAALAVLVALAFLANSGDILSLGMLPIALGSVLYPPEFFSGKPRYADLQTQAMTLGGSNLRYKLEKWGWLDQIVIKISGTYTVATAALTLKPRAPHNLIRSIILAPQGRQKFSDTAGGHAFRTFDEAQRGFTPFGGTARRWDVDGLMANAGVSAVLETFPTAVGAQAFTLWITINMRRSSTDPRGRVPLHNDQDTILYLVPNTVAELFGTPANFTVPGINVQVFQVTYDDVPESEKIKQFDRKWALIVEEFDQVAAIGKNDVLLPVGDDRVYLGIQHILALDDLGLATSGKIDTLDFKADRTDIIEPATPRDIFYYKMKREFGHTLPDGIVYYDFDAFADTDGSASRLDGAPYSPSLGRWLNTANIKTLRSRLNIPSGTALGAAPRIHTVLRYFMKLGD